MAGHLLATTRRIEEEEARKLEGWVPAGPPLTEAVDELASSLRYETGMHDAQIGETSSPPLPSVGMDVVYHLRAGDSRNMRLSFPATIISNTPEAGTVALVVTYDAGDWARLDHVKRRAEPEAGWDWIEGQRPLMVPEGFGTDISEHDLRSGAVTWPKDGEPLSSPPPISDLLVETRSLLNEAMATIGDLVVRVEAIEARPRPGRPAKPKE